MTKASAERWARWAETKPHVNWARVHPSAYPDEDIAGIDICMAGGRFQAVVENVSILRKVVAALAPRRRNP